MTKSVSNIYFSGSVDKAVVSLFYCATLRLGSRFMGINPLLSQTGYCVLVDLNILSSRKLMPMLL